MLVKIDPKKVLEELYDVALMLRGFCVDNLWVDSSSSFAFSSYKQSISFQ